MSLMPKIMGPGPDWARLGPRVEERADRWVEALVYWGLGLLAAVVLGLWPGWQLLEERARDALEERLLPPTHTHPGILLVDFSDASIAALQGWPVNRQTLADLAEALLGPLGARSVALDMVFPEAGDAVGDARLASLAEHAPLVLAHALDWSETVRPVQVGVPATGPTPPGAWARAWHATPATGYVANHTGLQRARCVGHIGMAPDADGVLRRLKPVVTTAQGPMATLTAAVLDCANRATPTQAASPPPPLTQTAAAPADWRLPLRHRMHDFDAVQAHEVLRGVVPREQVAGRLVLVGSSALGLSDYVATPEHPRTPGVVVHARALADMLDHGMPRPPATHAGWLGAGALAVMLALPWWVWHRRKWAAPGVWLVLAVLWLGTVLQVYSLGEYPAVLLPVAASLVALLGLALWQVQLARRVQRRALDALSWYVARPVLQELYALGLKRSLRPHRREITVLVVDMRNYTQMTHGLPLEEAAVLTQSFLEVITGPVLAHEGTLDRYTGDGLIAFWGAPLARADHADQALSCVAALQRALDAWNRRRTEQRLPAIGMRMGLESGTALVGDLGSSSRSIYTAVGDCINLASRLQELGRELDCDVVIGPDTARLCAQALPVLAEVAVRGLQGPTTVYTLPPMALGQGVPT